MDLETVCFCFSLCSVSVKKIVEKLRGTKNIWYYLKTRLLIAKTFLGRKCFQLVLFPSSSPVWNGFLRFTSGVTPADLSAARTQPNLFDPHICRSIIHKHWWGFEPTTECTAAQPRLLFTFQCIKEVLRSRPKGQRKSPTEILIPHRRNSFCDCVLLCSDYTENIDQQSNLKHCRMLV